MGNRFIVYSSWPLLVALVSTFLVRCSTEFDHENDRKVYIVYMGDRPKGDFSATAQHMSMLQATVGSERASDSLLYSYKRSFNGFVARLTAEEKNKISKMSGVVSVFRSTKKQLHTTRSWDFMGLPIKVERSKIESDIIIGMLDTGIWPESESFKDKEFGAPPTKWKGTCQSQSNFTCNKKIIGAKYYRSEGAVRSEDFPSPRDSEGHGTHTSSTAAGGIVYDASLYGLASGTARGAVPSARIAVYKICWSDGCSDADILAAFDDAIADGVDIISLSVGGISPLNYFEDSIAIGAFHAMRAGILTSNSAGNSGPTPGSITNFSPWSLSVAATTIDRKFLSKVQLGNGKTYEGPAVNAFTLEDDAYPLVYGGNVGYDSSVSRYCEPGSLDPNLVQGKIVFCDELSNAEGAAEANATGTIMQDTILRDLGFSFPVAASYLGTDDGANVYAYINQTSKPIATILKSVEANETLAPFVASFSSRGPSYVTPDVLKPDISAPGVDILAAWSEATTVTRSHEDTRVVPYNIISGTSMSCPHASGGAAYVKSFNPTWSPAAIKSALMTTATPMSDKTNPDAEFAYGSGHIDPLKAKSPGLVYDLAEIDYINFLCGQGYDNKHLQLITGNKTTCTKDGANFTTVYDLNYPSFSMYVALGSSSSQAFHRTVTNVGSPSSTYKAVVNAPSGLKIQVQPNILSFTSLGQKQKFGVTVDATLASGNVLSGSLVWTDGVHQVRSPIVAHPF